MTVQPNAPDRPSELLHGRGATSLWASRFIGACLLCAIVGVGCSSSARNAAAGAKSAADRATSGAQTPGGSNSTSTIPTRTVNLDKSVWWGVQQDRHLLFKIHFTSATYGSVSAFPGTTIAGLTTPTVPTLTVNFEAANLQAATRSLSFGSETTVTSRGKTATPRGGNPVDIASNATTTGNLVFQVDPSFSLDDAVLQLGGTDTNASIVPFAPSSRVTTFEPKVGFATGKLVGPDCDFTFVASRLYADTTPGQKGKYVVVIDLRATFKGPDAGGGGLVGIGDFSLKSPDGATTPGTQIVGEAADPLNANLQVGQTSPTEHVGFQVGQPVGGTYTVTYTAAQGQSQGQTAQTTFTVAQ